MSFQMPSYREEGAGFPVICLHASASSPGQWRALMARLAGRFRVIAPYRIGYGGNPAWRRGRPPRLADDVAALAPLLDAVGPSFASGRATRPPPDSSRSTTGWAGRSSLFLAAFSARGRGAWASQMPAPGNHGSERRPGPGGLPTGGPPGPGG